VYISSSAEVISATLVFALVGREFEV